MSEFTKVKFGDMAQQITTKIKPKETSLTTYVGLEHLDSESLQIVRYGTPEEVIGEKLRVCKGDIIFGKRRVYQRKVAIANFDGICSAHAMVLRPKEQVVAKDFFPFFMQSDVFMERALQISVGSLSPTINWKTLAEQEFCIPSLKEQRRIATVLWAAEDCVVKGERFVAAAERAKQVLMRELFSKGIGHTDLKKTSLGLLPSSWTIMPLSKISLFITNGFVGIATPYYSTADDGIIYLRSTNIRSNQINVNNCVYVTPEFNQIHKKSILKKGDMLTVQSGHIGTSAIVTKGIEGSNCHALIITRFIEGIVDPNFICLYLNSKYGMKRLSSFFIGSTVPHINTSDLKEFDFPVPPLPEQRKIANILNRCDETIAAARANVTATRALKMRLINEMLTPGENDQSFISLHVYNQK